MSRSVFLGAVPLLAALTQAARTNTLFSPTYGRLAFHFSLFKAALLGTYLAALGAGFLTLDAMLLVAAFHAVWWVAASVAFKGRVADIVSQVHRTRICAPLQLGIWR